jgi:hypothetical protein
LRDDVGHLGGQVTGVHDDDRAQRAQRGKVVVVDVCVYLGGEICTRFKARNADMPRDNSSSMVVMMIILCILTLLDGECPKRVLRQVIKF